MCSLACVWLFWYCIWRCSNPSCFWHNTRWLFLTCFLAYLCGTSQLQAAWQSMPTQLFWVCTHCRCICATCARYCLMLCLHSFLADSFTPPRIWNPRRSKQEGFAVRLDPNSDTCVGICSGSACGEGRHWKKDRWPSTRRCRLAEHCDPAWYYQAEAWTSPNLFLLMFTAILAVWFDTTACIYAVAHEAQVLGQWL